MKREKNWGNGRNNAQSKQGKYENPRLDKAKAHREYFKIAKSKKRNRKTIRKALKKQLSFVRRNLEYIENLVAQGHYELLSPKQKSELEIIKTLYLQQKQMIDEEKYSCENCIVSVSQPYVRPIVRGKANAKVEFGAKVAICVIGGYAFIDSFNVSTDFEE